MSERTPLAQFWLDETRTRKTLLWTGIGWVIGGVVLLAAAVIGLTSKGTGGAPP